MKKLLIILSITFSLAAYGQLGKFHPFKLIVIKPDTAIIDKSISSGRDTIEAGFMRRYCSAIKQMQQIADVTNRQDDTSFVNLQKEYRAQLVVAKAMEPEIKKFKYYQLLSSYATEVYNFYFNEYAPYSTIIELPNQATDIAALSNLADTAKADYVVFYSHIYSTVKDGLPI